MRNRRNWIILCAALTLFLLGSILLMRSGAKAEPLLQFGSHAGTGQSSDSSNARYLSSIMSPEDTATATPTCTSAWSVASSPNPGSGSNVLRKSAAISANDVWAVGHFTNGSQYQTLAIHWDGNQWSVVPSPNVGNNGSAFWNIAAISSNDVWAVGFYVDNSGAHKTLAEHWNGSAWSVVATPNIGASNIDLNGVAAISTNDVWAVGSACGSGGCGSGPNQTLAMHWDGTTWNITPTANPSGSNLLYGVTAVSTNDVWAVGYYGSCFACVGYNLVEHWNGTSWSNVPVPNVGPSTNSLYSVKAISANDIWAVGHSFYGSWHTLTLHYDGSSWSVVSSPSVGSSFLYGVSASSSNDVWAAGSGYSRGQTLILHWNGTSWSISPGGSVSGSNYELWGITSASSSEAWAVGFGDSHTVVEHYASSCQPATNTPVPTNTPVQPTNTPTCVAAWSIVNSPSVGTGVNSLRRAAIVSPNDIWAAGHYYNSGTGSLQTLIEHWNGTQWSVVASPNGSAGENVLYDIKAISANDIWAVGNYATTGARRILTLHYDGTQWNLVPGSDLSGYTYITGVAANAANDVWIVGFSCPGECFSGSTPGQTLTEHWNGTSWSVVSSPNVNTISNLWGVTAVSGNDVWAVGRSSGCYGCAPANLFLHWNGTQWSVVPSPNAGSSSNDLYDIVAVSANDVWAVGDYYAGVWRTLILHWDGTQWSVVSSPNSGGGDNHLYGIGSSGSNDVWAAGGAGNPEQALTLHWNGTTWSVVPSASIGGQNNRLNQAAAVSANDAWVIGATGNHTLVEHYTSSCSPATNTPMPTNTGVPPTNTPIPTNTPLGGDAFAHLDPAGPRTVMVGDKFTLDLKINSGSSDVNAAQSYMTFTNSVLQVVNVSQSGCVLTSTALPDFTVFDALLQNEICNGPNPCIFRGVSVDPGSIAFASGALSNPAAHGDFRVAQVAFCASTIGDAVIHWQFSPPAPITRDSEIISENGDIVSNRNLYTDYVVHVVPPSPTPTVESAFAHFAPAGPLNVTLGTTPARFTLDLMVNSGGYDVTVAQNYLTFTSSLLENVQAGASSCAPTDTVSSDLTTFDAQLQNEVCNGDSPCGSTPAASIAYASGALANPAAHGDFRVAQIAFCANTIGDAVIHWQFSPPAPANRDSQIRDEDNNLVSNHNLYADYVVHITSPNVLVGHVNWQGRPAQPNALQRLPITLTLKSGATEVNYASLNTDASGFFTVSVAGLANGTYSWRVKGPKFLANAGTVTLTGAASMNAEMGLLRAGDANNDNVITSLDFTIMKGTFGRLPGEPAYDARADFNGDDVVNAADFNLLRNNFGQGGAPPTNPGTGK